MRRVDDASSLVSRPKHHCVHNVIWISFKWNKCCLLLFFFFFFLLGDTTCSMLLCRAPRSRVDAIQMVYRSNVAFWRGRQRRRLFPFHWAAQWLLTAGQLELCAIESLIPLCTAKDTLSVAFIFSLCASSMHYRNDCLSIYLLYISKP